MSSRLYFNYEEGNDTSTVVGLSVAVRSEVEKKLSRVDIALVMQSGISVPEGTKIIALDAYNNMFIPREISIGVFSEDKQSGSYALVQSERVKFKSSDRVVAHLKDGVPYIHSLYVPYRENLHVSAVAQLVTTEKFDYDDFKYRRFKSGMPVELSCLVDSGEESDFNYEEWKDTDWD